MALNFLIACTRYNNPICRFVGRYVVSWSAMTTFFRLSNSSRKSFISIFSRGHTTLELAVSVGRLVGRSVCHVTFMSHAPAHSSATGGSVHGLVFSGGGIGLLKWGERRNRRG